MFLRAEKSCTHNTVWVYLMPLRKMIGIAIENGWLVRDLFVFCCFPGLSYCELYNFSEEHIRTYFDENRRIHTARQKTTVVSEV